MCALAEGTGRGCAATRYLLEECKAFEKAKGDYALRSKMHSQIIDVLGSVADALEGKKPAITGSTILDEFEALEGADASEFYKKHQDAILAAQQARIDNSKS